MSTIIDNKRFLLLLVLGLAVAALIILASGISNVTLSQGEARVFIPGEMDRSLEPERLSRALHFSLPRTNYTFFAIVGMAIYLYMAIRWRQIRALLLSLLGVVAIFLVLNGLYQLSTQVPALDVPPPEPLELPVNQASEAPPELVEPAPELLSGVSVVLTLALLLIVAAGGWLLWRQWQQRSRQPLDIITQEAETALANIRAGFGLREAILRCYYDMNEALKEQRGLVRREDMTPREFEEVLEKAGLPPKSVKRLTRLFEKARYSTQPASERERLEAMACLREITQAAVPQSEPPATPMSAETY